MKKNNLTSQLLTVLLVCIMLAALVSCKKNDTASTPVIPPTPTLAGVWSFVYFYESSSISSQGTGYAVTNPNDKLTIESNGNYSSVGQNYEYIGEPDSSKLSDNGTISQSDSLFLKSNMSSRPSIKMKLLKLTNNDLWFRYQVCWGDYYEVHFSK